MKKSILIIEKDGAVTEQLKNCLLSAGYDVCGVIHRGEEAISAVRTLRPALIIYGMELSGELDGVETASIITNRVQTPHLYLIDNADESQMQRIQASHPMGILSLPFEESRLTSAVNLAFEKIVRGQSSDWFESAFDHIEDGVITTDDDGEILRMNARAEVLTGFDFVAATGASLGEVLHLTEDSEMENPARHVLQTAKPYVFASEIQSGEKTVTVDCKCVPHSNKKGVIAGTVIVLREKKEPELVAAPVPAAVEEIVTTVVVDDAGTDDLRKRLELESFVGSIVLPLAGVETSQFQPEFENTLKELGEHLGMDYCSALTSVVNTPGEFLAAYNWGDPGKGLMAALLGFCGNETTWWHTHLTENHGILLRSGDDIPSGHKEELTRLAATGFESIVALPFDDEASGYLVMCAKEAHEWSEETVEVMRKLAKVAGEILKRNRACVEREIRANELVQSRKLDAIGKLSGGIAHDFNNILVPIIGYSDVIIERMEADGESSEEIAAIRSAAESAAALTRQLLSFARKQILKKSRTNMHDIVTDIQQSLTKLLGEETSLEVYSSRNTWNMIADRSQCEQILTNLCVNARDAMKGSGSIIINVENVELPNGKFIYLSVEDTGPGMDRKVLERVFEPFFSTKENNGTGLGLSVVLGIVEQHQGRISVDSEPGRGSRFNIWIPAAAGAEVEEEVRPVTARSLAMGGQETILLIEDEKSVIEFVSQALRKKGYQVETAMSVAEAYRVYGENAGLFDLIFSDAMLPDGTGMEVVEKLLGENESLRALLSSGYTDNRALVDMANEPRISFLHKPYSLPDLYKTVRAVLDDEDAALLS